MQRTHPYPYLQKQARPQAGVVNPKVAEDEKTGEPKFLLVSLLKLKGLWLFTPKRMLLANGACILSRFLPGEAGPGGVRRRGGTW